MQRSYYADAFQESGAFVRACPELSAAHAAMGEALLGLDRTDEAVAVLGVAHSLHTLEMAALSRSKSENQRQGGGDAVQHSSAFTGGGFPASLVHNNFMQFEHLRRLSEALYTCNNTITAEDVYISARDLLLHRISTSAATGAAIINATASECAVLTRLGQVQLSLNKTHAAYVSLLQCVKYCPEYPEGYLQLGKLRGFHNTNRI